MTREEAIKELKIIREDYWDEYNDPMPALDMAIKALQQEPCEDAISRQAAIDIVRHECGEWKGLAKEIVKQFNGLPPVQPKQKTGHWIKITPSGIYMCSECEQNVLTGDIDAYHYCHHCGIKMIESQESEE